MKSFRLSSAADTWQYRMVLVQPSTVNKTSVEIIPSPALITLLNLGLGRQPSPTYKSLAPNCQLLIVSTTYYN